MSIKFSSTFLIWVAAAVLFTLTAVGGHGFAGTWTTLSPGAALSDAMTSVPSTVAAAGPLTVRQVDNRPMADKLNGVVAALQAGNIDQLSRYFDAYVDLTLPERHIGSYSRSQAKMVLGDFFETYKVKGFNIQVKGEGGSTGYCIGTLQTTGGNFRTSLFVREEGDQSMIKELDLSSH
jgi:hypothetical protein